jgi:hypothetical protein
LFGVILPPLLTSLYHFADRPEFVDALPALLDLLWELDEMNKFFVGSKAAFKNLHLAKEADKRRRRQEAAQLAAAAAAAEASRTPSYKDRKAARRKKTQSPAVGSPAVLRAEEPLSGSSPAVPEEEVEAAEVRYPFDWLLELEKTLGTLCGTLASTMVAGTPYTSKEKPYLSHLRSSGLFSAGLEDTEEEALVGRSSEGMEVEVEAEKLQTGDFFGRLMRADDADDELGPLVKWISSAGPRLPIPAQAEQVVASAVRGTFAAIAKHAGLESQLVEWAAQLRAAAQKRMELEEAAKEGEDAPLPPSPPSSLQSVLSTAGAIRLWIMQQQQTIISEAVQKHDEEKKEWERRREERLREQHSKKGQEDVRGHVARARQSLQQLHQQLMQQNVELDEDVMWEIMVEEEEEARLKGEEDDDEDVEYEDEEDEELSDEEERAEEAAAIAAEEEKARVRRAEESARRAAKGKKKGSSEEEEEEPAPSVPTREEVYTRLAKHVLSEASFLLRFASSAKSMPTSSSSSQELMAQARATVSFIQLLLPLEPLEQLVRLHTLRSRSRCRGLRTFIDLLDRCSLPAAKREVVKHLGRSLRYCIRIPPISRPHPLPARASLTLCAF